MDEAWSDDALRAFLVEAKRGTYAAGGDAGRVPSLLAGAHQLEYRSGSWLYRDLYYGSARFAGQETVSVGDAPVWSMVYAGGVPTGAGVSPSEVYAFLRLALQRVSAERPYRGPEGWEMGAWRYACAVSGDLWAFEGRERIARDGREVYALVFAGGAILSTGEA